MMTDIKAFRGSIEDKIEKIFEKVKQKDRDRKQDCKGKIQSVMINFMFQVNWATDAQTFGQMSFWM